VVANVGGDPWLFDASDPLAPAMIAQVPVADFDHVAWDGDQTIYLALDRPYDQDEDTQIVRVDVSDPTDPQIAGLLVFAEPSASIDAILARDGWVFAGMDESLVAVDFSDPQYPTEAGGIGEVGGYIDAMVIDDDRLLVTTGHELMTVDVSTPSLPQLVHTESLMVSSATRMALAGDVLYLATGSGFHVFGLTGADAPSFVGWFGHPERIHAIAVAGGRVVTVGGNERLAMVPLQCVASAAPEELPGSVQTLRAWPNPFNPQVQLEAVVPTPGPVRVTVHDLTGRRVATIADETLAAGPARWIWRGTDDGGRALSSGVYLARFVSATSKSAAKLVLVR
jgi:hypothetical protein